MKGLAVIDANGVGYACFTSQNTLAALQEGKRARLYTCLYVREDIFDLYGFAQEEELAYFKLLISVSGVGPKAALSILSVANPSQIALSVLTGDAALFVQAPGIGKKIAQRIVLELRDKMTKEQLSAAGEREPEGTAGGAAAESDTVNEAVSALVALGYSRPEALKAMEGMDTAGAGAEDMIKYCLKKLAF